MFIGDRPTTPYDLNFRLLGVPVRVHPLFWLVAAVLDIHDVPKYLLMWIGVVFVSVLVHEMGHALTIRSFGWRPSILLYTFGGLAMYQPTRQDPRKQIVISLAGPAAGFLLAALVALLVKASGNPVLFWFGKPRGINFAIGVENENLFNLVAQLLEVNIWWGVMNLLPVWPLDGGHVCYELLSELRVPQALPKALTVSVLVAGAVAVYAIASMHDIWLALLFGYLAFDSYSTLASFHGRGGGYGGRW